MIREWMILTAALFAAAPAMGQAPDPDRFTTTEQLEKQLADAAEVTKNILVPMRDGVGLSTDVYLPKTRGGKVPVIFVRSPYNYNPMGRGNINIALKGVQHGYAVVLQNERGKFYSEGDWKILGYPQTDGVDALDWLAEQDWSTGKVGLFGCSSTAEWQLALAAQNHPALAAMVAAAPGAGIGKVGPYWEQGNWYRGGAQQMFYPPWLRQSLQTTVRPTFPPGMTQEERARFAKVYALDPDLPKVDWAKSIRHLPLNDMLDAVDSPNTTFDEFTAHEPGDAYWREGGLFHDGMQINAPTLWLFSWFDVSSAPNIALFNHARTNKEDPEAARNQFMAVGPNLHCQFFGDNPGKVGERTFPDAALDYYDILFAFYDRFLKGARNGFERSTPPVRYYEMGADAWRWAQTWPPQGARETVFYLDSEAGANSLYGDGALSSAAPAQEGVDTFSYDPMNPVASRGGAICCIGGAVEGGVFDQRPNEVRNDVLIYTSAPLTEALRVAGPVKLTLHVSSDAPDTDFMVKLVDVFPDGTAYNLDETAQRVRWREGYDKPPQFMKAGETYEVTIQPMVTANYFAPGHRIRLEVTSSNFPRFARNLNTAEPVAEQKEPRIARNAVHHGPASPSRLTLTVVR